MGSSAEVQRFDEICEGRQYHWIMWGKQVRDRSEDWRAKPFL